MPTMRRVILAVLALAWVATLPALAQSAGRIIDVGGRQALLMVPKAPRASLILMPGGDGRVTYAPDGDVVRMAPNVVVRTRTDFAARGFATLLIGSDVDVRAAIAVMRRFRKPVVILATSRGTQRVAQAIAAGARPDRLVLSSGFLSPASGGEANVMSILRSPAALPPTLVIHHRQDQCHVTRPAGVAPFLAWAGSKARVIWIDGGVSEGRHCGARAHHGYNGVESRFVAAVASVLR